MWSLEIMVKVDIIWGKILAIKDQFYLESFPCEQIPFQNQQYNIGAMSINVVVALFSKTY